MKTNRLIHTALAFAGLGVASLQAQDIVLKLQESFETDGLLENPPRYTVENMNTESSNSRYFERRIIPSEGVGASGGVYDGDYIWGGRGINYGTVEDLSANEGRITFPVIDISDVGNVFVEIAVAEGGAEFEGNNIFYLEASVDGAPWQVIGGFRSTGTNTSARYFQGDETVVTTLDDPRLSTTFYDFGWDLFESGNSLQLRIMINVNAIAEQYYFDNIRVYGDASLTNLNASTDASEYAEPAGDGSTPATLTLTLGKPAPAGGQSINLILDGELMRSTDLPESVMVNEGETSLQVPFNILQDGQYTGQKKMILQFTGEGLGREQVTFYVNNSTPRPDVIVTEILSAPPSDGGGTPDDLSGDTNGDGVRDGSGDEFVEIVNFGSEPVDISGYTLADALQIRHVFPEGTILKPMRSAVVWGSGNPVGVFGGAQTFVADAGSLALNNSGDTLTFSAPYGQVMETKVFDATWGQAPLGSRHRGNTLESEFVLHQDIPEANGAAFSPGTLPSGEPFGTFANTLTIQLDANELEESAAPIMGTVQLQSPAPAGGLVIQINTDGWILQGDGTYVPDELSLSTTELMVPEGQSSASFEITPFDDGILDGDKLVRIVASESDDVLPGLVTLTILDVAPNPYNLVINEILSDVEGTGLDPNLNGVFEETLEDQFVEILNLGTDPVDLSGWALHARRLSDVSGNTLAHVFPAGTIMAGESAMVIFGGGDMIGDEPNSNLVPDSFGGAYVQTARIANGNANVNGVNLPTGGPEMYLELMNQHGFVINRLDLVEGMTNQGSSVVLYPEGTGEPALHFGVSQSFSPMSPGLDLSDSPFPGSNDTYFWMNAAFPGIALTGEAPLDAGVFGFVTVGMYPYVYMHSTDSFWYIYGDVGGTFYAYDFTAGEWIATGDDYFPYAYLLETGDWMYLGH